MASTGTFSSALIAEKCHHTLVNLGEGEIKAIESLKVYLTKQVSIIDQYLHAIQKLNSASDIAKYGLDEDSPFFQTWHAFYSENVQVTSVLSQLSSSFSTSIVPRLDKLLTFMREAHKHYKSQRFRVDSELKTACEQGNRLKTTYHQHAEEAESARLKFEASVTSKGQDKAKEDKYKKSSLKLFQNHNDYVLALTTATIHQHNYDRAIIPSMMNSLQSIKEDLVLEWKNILTDISTHINAYARQYMQLSESMNFSLNNVNDDNPYETFIANKGAHPDPHPDFLFDTSLLDMTQVDLKQDELVLNDLTYEQLKTKITLLEKTVNDTKLALNDKTSQYDTSKQMLKELKESSSSSINNIFDKEVAVADLALEVKQLSCAHEKAVAQREMVSSILEQLNGTSPEKFSGSLVFSRSDSFGSSETKLFKTFQRVVKGKKTSKKSEEINEEMDSNGPRNPENHSADGVTGPRRKLPRAPSDVQPASDPEDTDDEATPYEEPVETALEDELWYYGPITRPECEALLIKDGDYLVRESSRKPGSYVLSVKWETPRHFIIQQDEGKFRLEGEAFPTITHLVDTHRKHQCEVTKKSSALLKHPVLRKATCGKSLIHKNIIVEAKLGRGHFGDVMRGRLKDTGEEVAIKTCRDGVFSSMKEKFLQEAEILGQYNHPNIVKLIGVAIDEEPVYIVMELMEGGDFLNYLRKNGSHILPAQLLQFAIDAANGMTYLEKKGCIHRDLAARNCLLNKEKVLKISDFGMSRETDLYECSNMREIPVKWTAPEALNYTQYTSHSDVWSFGVLLWETYSLGNTPYPGMGNKETREQVDRGYRLPPPLGTPPVIYTLMKDCWQYEPDQRPHFSVVLRRLRDIHALG